jgi:hypothetical protein
MRVAGKTRESLELYLPSETHRDLGIFLIFFAVFGIFPLQYIAGKFVELPWDNLRPAALLTALMLLAGFYLIFKTRKKIVVTAESLSMKDGFFIKPLTFRWKSSPSIRLGRIEAIRRSVPVEDWLVFLVDGRHQYLVERSIYHQLEMRALAEEMAKFLCVPLVDASGEEGDMIIECADLDLPYRERVQKYPHMIGPRLPRPALIRMKESDFQGGREYSWGIATAGFLMEILMASIFILLLTFVPWLEEGGSFYAWCSQRGYFFFYEWFAVVMTVIIIIVAGYRVRFRVNGEAVELIENFWKIPFSMKRISVKRVEEVRYYLGIRGPVFQVISDNSILSFRLPDKERARWLTSEVRHLVAGVEKGDD